MPSSSSPTTRVEFVLNGRPASVRSDHPHLLAALREELDVTSAKDGCSPSGQCGCCTILIDGKAQVSCQFALSKLAGRSLHVLCRVGTNDATNSFKAYSAPFVRAVGIESDAGFEVVYLDGDHVIVASGMGARSSTPR